MPGIIIKDIARESALKRRDAQRRQERNLSKVTPAHLENIKRRSLEHPSGKPFPRYGRYRRKYEWDGEKMILVAGEE